MADKRYKKSYTDQKKQRNLVGWILLWFMVFYLSYTLLTSFVFSTRVLHSNTMQPELQAGDRFICSSYMLTALLDRPLPLRRGNIVIVNKNADAPRSVIDSILEGFTRFFTAQQVSPSNEDEDTYIKRVIGLPGDEITMTNYVFRIKPRGSSYSLTEFEIAEKPYDVTIPSGSALWDESLPFSGNMATIVLRDNECFVVSDDRNNTNDSRTWGTVSLDLIVGKAVFRYWPFLRMGSP
jgi:signal peptidase I